MRQPRCLGLEGLEIIIKRKTALSAVMPGTSLNVSLVPVQASTHFTIMNVGQMSLMTYQPKG